MYKNGNWELTPNLEDVNMNSVLSSHRRPMVYVQSFILDPDMNMSCRLCSTLSVWLPLRNECSLAHHRQTLLPKPRQTILLYTQVQYQRGTVGSYVCRESLPRLRLAYPAS